MRFFARILIFLTVFGHSTAHHHTLCPDAAFFTPQKKVSLPTDQLKISSPSTSFRSNSTPIVYSTKKTSKNVSQYGDAQLSVSSVSKAVASSLRSQGLGDAVVPTILDVVPSNDDETASSVINFVSETAHVSTRTVQRKLSERLETPHHIVQPASSSSKDIPSNSGTCYYFQFGLTANTPHSKYQMQLVPFLIHCRVLMCVPDSIALRLTGGANHGGRRKRRTLEEIKNSGDANTPKLSAFLDSLQRITNVRSGSDGVRHFRRATWGAAYIDYLEDVSRFGIENECEIPTLGFEAFCKWSRSWNIRLFCHDRYACPLCERAISGEPPDGAYTHHRWIVEGMGQVYEKVRASLSSPDTILVIIDYCRHHTIQAISVNSHEKQKRDPNNPKKKTTKTSHFCATMVTSTYNEVGRCSDVHLDVIGQVKQGPSFMASGIRCVTDYILQNYPQRKKVHFFADCGLRSWGTLECISQLSLDLDSALVDVHYFASYHGHNPCDAHFGHVKSKIKRSGKQGMLHPDDLLNFTRSLPRTHVHEILSTTPPLDTSLFIRNITLSNYQSFQLKRTDTQIQLVAFPLGSLFGNPTATFSFHLHADAKMAGEAPRPRAPRQAVRDDVVDDDLRFLGDEDSDVSSMTDSDIDELYDSEPDGTDSVDSEDKMTDSSGPARRDEVAPRVRPGLEDALETMSCIRKVSDAYYFLTNFVTERGSIDRVVQSWKDHCKCKPTEDDRNAFVQDALLILNAQPPQ